MFEWLNKAAGHGFKYGPSGLGFLSLLFLVLSLIAYS